MTEFPALRDALVAAGRRRRRRRRVAAVVPTLAVAVAAVAWLPGAAPEREAPARQPRDPLEQTFAVFGRPQTPADVLPAGREVDRTRSRLLGRIGRKRAFAVPRTLRGEPMLCVTIVDARSAGGAACSRLSQLENGIGFWSGKDYALLLPDGAHDVFVNFGDGSRLAPQSEDNAVLGSRKGFAGASWTDRDGVRHMSPNALRPKPLVPRSCPADIEPRRGDAFKPAARAALLVADLLYPTATRARVVAYAEGPRGLAPCPDSVLAQAVVIGLKLDDRRKPKRVLVGKVGGTWQVFYKLD
jgi:hypothetical protein